MSKKKVLLTIIDVKTGEELQQRVDISPSMDLTNWTIYMALLGLLKSFEDDSESS